MKLFETFDHGADIGIRGFGKTLEEAFANGAKAMFSIMVDINKVEKREEREISCEAPDIEMLFVEWLNQLLSISHLEKMVFNDFHVTIKEGTSLTGYAGGEKLDKSRHPLLTEVKAATYSMLKVEKNNDVYIAQCVVDV